MTNKTYVESYSCRACGQPMPVETIFDLGEQYLSDFGDTRQYRPPKAPLALKRCKPCGLVQLSHTVSRSQMYHDHYGYRSGVNAGIRANLWEVVQQGLDYVPEGQAWLDIASNDGTLLSYVPRDWIRVGVDPVKMFAPEARRHANRIIDDYFSTLHFAEHERFDVITAVSMFYDLSDPAAFIYGVTKLLAEKGVLIIQQNYLPDMVSANSFDNICHEHLTYFDLATLEPLLHQFGLQVLRVDRSPVNGGCFRTVIGHSGALPVEDSVQQMRDQEAALDLPWDGFRKRSQMIIEEIRNQVARAWEKGQPVYIYGASTRGAVIWQAARLTSRSVTAAVEIQSQKIGRFYSAVDGIPIISDEEMRRLPGLTLVGPYWHRGLFLDQEQEYMKDGGRLLFPIPQVEVVGGDSV